jgi:AraC family transcriptional regulator, regulatory protein of adaptative response / DNA-3-methyladenine glycosylase II
VILNSDQCYQSVLTRDSRFDGRFFVAVRTTRIYCRPICRVKPPLQKNCTFYTHAVEAEVAGYRPCKLCRPELAPGSSAMDVSSQLARDTASYINQDFLADHSLSDLAGKLGITDRQMRRVFHEEFGVSPIEYWQTQRLLLAKQLLTDSRLAVASVALASGFQSLRRFNFALKERYRMTPTELRKRQKERPAEHASEFSFRLSYLPPFDWEHLLGFLSRRAIPAVEAVADGAYFRTVRLSRQGREYAGFLEVRHDSDKRMLIVRLSDALAPVCVIVLERIKRLFDLEADSMAIKKVLGALAKERPGLRVPGSFDSFEMSVRAILGQQVSVIGARTLAGRMVTRFGTPLRVPVESLSYLFPTASRMARASVDEIGRLGIIGRRAETIIALAKMVSSGELCLEPGNRVEGTLRQLRKIPGVGEWTAQYIAMRALSWPDAFPHTDLGICKALGERNPKKVLSMTEQWRPWRAYAALHLWASPEKKS